MEDGKKPMGRETVYSDDGSYCMSMLTPGAVLIHKIVGKPSDEGKHRKKAIA